MLKDNKNNSKKVWNIVNELVYNRKQKNSGPTKILTDTGCTITDPQAIAEEFNKFFVSVGKRMAAKISAHDKPPDTQSNLKKIKKISNSIFLSPCTIAVPAGGAGGAIAPPSFEDLGKIKIFRAVRRKYLGKTIVFRAAI